jgi:hypothetical protein
MDVDDQIQDPDRFTPNERNQFTNRRGRCVVLRARLDAAEREKFLSLAWNLKLIRSFHGPGG